MWKDRTKYMCDIPKRTDLVEVMLVAVDIEFAMSKILDPAVRSTNINLLAYKSSAYSLGIRT